MEYTYKNQLRKLVLVPENYHSATDINILHGYLAQTVVDLNNVYTTKRIPPVVTDEGDVIAAQHLRNLEEVKAEVSDLVQLLPDYITKVLAGKDLKTIWGIDDKSTLANNPLRDRQQDFKNLLDKCVSDATTLGNILEVTEKISLGSENLYILDTPEDGSNGLQQYEDLLSQLKQKTSTDFQNHPAIRWCELQLKSIRDMRRDVIESLKKIDCAAEFDVTFGWQVPEKFPQGHELYTCFMEFLRYRQGQQDKGWIEWAHSELQKLSHDLDPNKRTHWHYRVKYGKYLVGEKSVRNYLEDEIQLIKGIRTAQQFCENIINQVNNGIPQPGEILSTFLAPLVRSDKKACLDHAHLSLKDGYLHDLLTASYTTAFVYYVKWLGSAYLTSDETNNLENDTELNKRTKMLQDFLDQFTNWKKVEEYCAKPKDVFHVEDSIKCEDPNTLFGWACGICEQLSEISQPESGMPGASNERRQLYISLEIYREKVKDRIGCARVALDELYERKLRWNLATREVSLQGSIWSSAQKMHWIIRWFKRKDPDKEFKLLHPKICECCQLAPRFDLYRKMYGLNCDPENKPCQYLPR